MICWFGSFIYLPKYYYPDFDRKAVGDGKRAILIQPLWAKVCFFISRSCYANVASMCFRENKPDLVLSTYLSLCQLALPVFVSLFRVVRFCCRDITATARLCFHWERSKWLLRPTDQPVICVRTTRLESETWNSSTRNSSLRWKNSTVCSPHSWSQQRLYVNLLK